MNGFSFTIDLAVILQWFIGISWMASKFASAYFVSLREFQYPIWNKDGVQVNRGIGQKIKAVIQNFSVNPEWAIMKLIAFLPVWVFTKMKYWDVFSPWHIQKTPPLCPDCGDKGRYKNNQHPFLVDTDKPKWVVCHCCQNEKQPPGVNCSVCLDLGHIGGERPCPHCEHSRVIKGQHPSAKSRDYIECVVCNRHLLSEDYNEQFYVCRYCTGERGKS